MSEKTQTLESVTRAIRLCFGKLRAIGDDLHADIGVTSAMRAVMELLAERREATVPDIARAKLVSRQSVQVLVDALLDKALVEVRPNPAHKRSSLIALTAHGETTFRRMRRREQAVLAAVARELPAAKLEETLATLGALARQLDENAPTSPNQNGENDD